MNLGNHISEDDFVYKHEQITVFSWQNFNLVQETLITLKHDCHVKGRAPGRVI